MAFIQDNSSKPVPEKNINPLIPYPDGYHPMSFNFLHLLQSLASSLLMLHSARLGKWYLPHWKIRQYVFPLQVTFHVSSRKQRFNVNK